MAVQSSDCRDGPLKITYVRGDGWEGIYINGVLAYEAHGIFACDVLRILHEKTGIEADTIGADIDWLDDMGSLPLNIEDVVTE